MTNQRAKPVLAWTIVRPDGQLASVAFPRRPDEEMLLPGERVARVEIREDDDGFTAATLRALADERDAARAEAARLRETIGEAIRCIGDGCEDEADRFLRAALAGEAGRG